MRKDIPFLCFLAASLAITFDYFQPWSTLALHIKDLGFSSSTYGMLISLNGLLIITLELPITSLTHKLPPRPCMAAGFALLGAGFFATRWAATIPAIAATVCVWTLGEMISAPVTAAFAANLAPEALRGRYMGAVGLTWSLGVMTAPAIGIQVYQRSPSALWSLAGFAGVAAAFIILAGAKSPGEFKKTAKAPEKPLALP
jgi:predicted MFS family arabinose efflux permease